MTRIKRVCVILSLCVLLSALASCNNSTGTIATPSSTATAPVTTILPSSEVPDDEPVIGGDWQTLRSYSSEYALSDDLTVCFSPFSEGEGFAIYDASDGVRIGSLLLPNDYYSVDIDVEGLSIMDYDGDGTNDIGAPAVNGSTIWYRWNPDEFGSWPENSSGGFDFLWRDTGIYNSDVIYPYETYAVSALNESQKALYDDVYQKIRGFEEFSYEAEVYGYETLDDLYFVWYTIKTDYPEIANYFMLYENISEEGLTLSLDSVYFCVWEDIDSTDIGSLRAGLDVFERECDDIVGSIPENASTFEKYRYLAVEISKRVQYDYDFTSPAKHTAYSLITGYAICQGYAELYQYLCSKAGLWCRVVEGSSEGVSHGWNLVMLENGTYHVDITWADEMGEPGSSQWMRYFMLTQEEILLDHEISDGTEADGIGF